MPVNIVCTHDAKTVTGHPAMLEVVHSKTDSVTIRAMFKKEDGSLVSHLFILDAVDTMNLGLGLIKEAWSIKP